MSLAELIEAIGQKNAEEGFERHPPATAEEVRAFERVLGFELPADFARFYSLCNGFATEEDGFNFMGPDYILYDETHYGPNWFYIAEFLIFCDAWAVRVFSPTEYEIYEISHSVVLTRSLHEFLERFLLGHVNGLYEWKEQIEQQATK